MSQPRIKRRIVVAQGDGTTAPPDERHNYIRRLLVLHEAGQLPAAGVLELDIRHDDWCGIFHGEHCNCEPGMFKGLFAGHH
jgi:hypothetical protein